MPAKWQELCPALPARAAREMPDFSVLWPCVDSYGRLQAESRMTELKSARHFRPGHGRWEKGKGKREKGEGRIG
jgi:hypothetical protein